MSAAKTKAQAIIDNNAVDDGSEIQSALYELSNQTTVPNIFINKIHIGGNSDLQSAQDKLPEMLKDAGAL
ncbi:MAG: hypothetical protein Q9163_002066 [Psora crenata]